MTTKSIKIGRFFLAAALLFGFSIGQARAQGVYVNTTYGGPNVYYPGYYYPQTPVFINTRPTLIFERRGSNDYLYEYDNVYGPEASAAGRMSRTVVIPPPQYYIVR